MKSDLLSPRNKDDRGPAEMQFGFMNLQERELIQFGLFQP